MPSLCIDPFQRLTVHSFLSLSRGQTRNSGMKVSYLLFSIFLAISGRAAEPKKKLIEFGWDEPSTAFLRQHIDEMKRTPFDGCVFHADYAGTNGSKGSFTWQAWGKRAFQMGELKQAMEDLRAIKFGNFRENFLRFNTTPADVDWFDDFGAIRTNAFVAARFAREARCPGLLFDIEQYNGMLFDYRKQREAASKSWEVYAAQARRRGAEVMDAFQEGYPGLKIFLTFGYSLPWQESGAGKKNLAECHYGLLAPFLDGMLERARGKTRLIDGHELSYGYKEPERFKTAYQTMKKGLLPIVRDAGPYQKFFEAGFGIWLDENWRKLGWSVEEPQKNYFTPAGFETSVRAALETADEYVWIYSETPRWWTEQGGPAKLPQVYQEALRRAHGSPK